MNQDRFDIEYEGNTIMEDAMIFGRLKSDCSLCLDGFIQGDVCISGRLIVNKTGEIDGDVECEELYINGKITGNVCVSRKTVMGANALIEGGLITANLEITPGAKILKGLKLKNASK